MKNKSTINILMGVILFTTIYGCKEETMITNRKVKLITEWECDPCLWGLNVFKRKTKTQYFDSSGKLTVEVYHLTSNMFDVREHHYDRFNRLSYLKGYRVEKLDTLEMKVYAHSYSADSKLVKVQLGEGQQLGSLRTYGYDALGRKIREDFTLFRGGGGKDIEDFREYQYDSLNRLIRHNRIFDGPREGIFYTYPSPTLELETRYDQPGQKASLKKRYLNARGGVVADSAFIYASYASQFKLKNNLYSIGKYTYDKANRLVKYYHHYYYLTDCAVGRNADWYTQIIEYEYEFYD